MLLPGAVLFAGSSILTAGIYAAGRPFTATMAQVLGMVVTVVGLVIFLDEGGVTAAADGLQRVVRERCSCLPLAYRSVSGLSWGALVPTPARLRALAGAGRSTVEPTADAAHRPGTRLPAHAARRRADVRRDHRYLARRPDRDPPVRRAGDAGSLRGRQVTTSPLDRLGIRPGQLPPAAAAVSLCRGPLPLDGFDCVVSSSSAFAHGVRPLPSAVPRLLLPLAVPLRVARAGARADRGTAARAAAAAAAPAPPSQVRPRAARRVDQYVANSEITRSGSSASGAATPRSCTRPSTSTDSRSASLRTTCSSSASWWPQARRAGDRGGDRGRTPAQARGRRTGARPPASVRTPAGWTSWARSPTTSSARLYAGAQALVVPNVEEFGIAAVEAQAAGRPVVGIDAGGLRETVLPGRRACWCRPTTWPRWPRRCSRTSLASTQRTSARTPRASPARSSRRRCGRW